jgi:Ca2+-binding RTX toxin-like protein
MAHVTSHRPGLLALGCALSCAGLLGWLAPSPAAAATVGTAKIDGSGKVVYTAVLGVDNDLTLSPTGATNNFRFEDAAGSISVQSPCTLQSDGSAICPRPSASSLRAVEIDLRNGNDVANLSSPINTITRAWLGNGDDVLSAQTAEGVVADGQAGDDTLTGGDPVDPTNFTDQLDGGFGDDTIDGRGGKDTIRGGPNKDKLTGGSGTDLIEGGFNADEIFAVDGERDTIDCGNEVTDGTDTAHFDDGLDAVKPGCEDPDPQ